MYVIIYSSGYFSCYNDQSLQEESDIMSNNDIRRLVVLERQLNAVIGVISFADMVKGPDSKRILMTDDVMHHLFRYA